MMEDYIELLNFAQSEAEKGRSVPVFNRDSQHASELVATLVDGAESSIDILTGTLDPQVYLASSVMAAIQRLKGKPSVRILFDGRSIVGDKNFGEIQSQLSGHKFISELIGVATSVTVRFAESNVAEKFSYHFLLVDKKRFRFERNWKAQEAFAYFLNDTSAKILAERFEEIWSLARPVPMS